MKRVHILLLILSCMILSVTAIADEITLTTIAPGGTWARSTDAGHENDIYAVNSIGTLDKVGIGTTEPDFKLHVSTPNGPGTLGIDGYSTCGALYLRQANGTLPSPAASGSGSPPPPVNLGFIGFRGYAGTGASGAFTTDRASIQAYTVAPWTTTDQGAAMAFSTTPDGSTTMQTSMVISPRGNVGINETAPHEKLDVGGGIRIGMAPATNTTLAAAMTNSAATATVASTAGHASTGIILIDDELMIYAGITATTFTGLTRGAFGTTAAAHTNTKPVYTNFITASNGESTVPVLSVTSAGNVGIGATSPKSTLQVNGPVATAVSTRPGFNNGTLLDTDSIVCLTNGGTTLLPDATKCKGRQYTIKRTWVTDGNIVGIRTFIGGQTIDGITGMDYYGLTKQWQYVTVVSNGSNWLIVNEWQPFTQSGFFQNTGTAANTVTVAFPEAFETGTKPVVVMTRNWFKAGDAEEGIPVVCKTTNTNFTIRANFLNETGDNGYGEQKGFYWQAIGER